MSDIHVVFTHQVKLFSQDSFRLYFLLQFLLSAFGLLALLSLQMVLTNIYSKKQKKSQKVTDFKLLNRKFVYRKLRIRHN
jgi:hypothetical protein